MNSYPLFIPIFRAPYFFVNLRICKRKTAYNLYGTTLSPEGPLCVNLIDLSAEVKKGATGNCWNYRGTSYRWPLGKLLSKAYVVFTVLSTGGSVGTWASSFISGGQSAGFLPISCHPCPIWCLFSFLDQSLIFSIKIDNNDKIGKRLHFMFKTTATLVKLSYTEYKTGLLKWRPVGQIRPAYHTCLALCQLQYIDIHRTMMIIDHLAPRHRSENYLRPFVTREEK